MSFCVDELGKLAHRLAEAGPAAVRDELAELALRECAAGVDPLLVEVMCDEREPAVVRQRAFARAAAQYVRLRRGLDNDQEDFAVVGYTG